jgi:hypothetical protein
MRNRSSYDETAGAAVCSLSRLRKDCRIATLSCEMAPISPVHPTSGLPSSPIDGRLPLTMCSNHDGGHRDRERGTHSVLRTPDSYARVATKLVSWLVPKGGGSSGAGDLGWPGMMHRPLALISMAVPESTPVMAPLCGHPSPATLPMRK